MNVFLIGCRSALCVTASNSKWFLCLVFFFFFFFFPPVYPFNSSKSHGFRGSSRWKAKYDKRLVSLLANGSEGHIFPWLRLDWKLKKKTVKIFTDWHFHQEIFISFQSGPSAYCSLCCHTGDVSSDPLGIYGTDVVMSCLVVVPAMLCCPCSIMDGVLKLLLFPKCSFVIYFEGWQGDNSGKIRLAKRGRSFEELFPIIQLARNVGQEAWRTDSGDPGKRDVSFLTGCTR